MKTVNHAMNTKSGRARATLLMTMFFCLMGLTASGQENVYLIDGQYVPEFNGSQLVGKTVKQYIVNTRKQKDGKDVKMHIIITDAFKSRTAIGIVLGNAKIKADDYNLTMNRGDSSNLISMSVIDPSNPDKAVLLIRHSGLSDTSKTAVFSIVNNDPKQVIKYVVDGKLFDKYPGVLKKIKPSDIERVSILKEGSPEQLKYGKGFTVVVINTKGSKNK